MAADYLNASVDAGITPLRYALGDQVWLDANHDGHHQSEEPAASATVSLLSDRRAVLATTATDAAGHYQFSDLPAGRYRLHFSGLPPHRAFCVAGAGGDAGNDSDADPRTGVTPVFRLDQNAPNLVPAADVGLEGVDFVNATASAGLAAAYSIGDTVWRDHNGNGVQDPVDGGVSGVAGLTTRGTVGDQATPPTHPLSAVSTVAGTGGVPLQLSVGGLALTFGGIGCLVAGRRHNRG